MRTEPCREAEWGRQGHAGLKTERGGEVIAARRTTSCDWIACQCMRLPAVACHSGSDCLLRLLIQGISC